jgi:hypothetical protein
MAYWLYSSGTTGRPKAVIHLHHDMLFCVEPYVRHVLGLTRGTSPSAALLLLASPRASAAAGSAPPPSSCQARSGRLRRSPRSPDRLLLRAFAGLAAPGRGTRPTSRRSGLRVRRELPGALSAGWPRVGTSRAGSVPRSPSLSNRPAPCGGLVGLCPVAAPASWTGTGRRAAGTIGDSGCPGVAGGRYWNKHEKTKAAFVGEWYRTGDKCLADADGYYFYQGRADDLLRVGANWVSPLEVESCLLEHPAVAECAVVGGRDADGLEKPRAFVVLQPGASADGLEETLRAHVRARLAPFKAPRWVTVIAELPKTATGKVQRYRLRAG